MGAEDWEAKAGHRGTHCSLENSSPDLAWGRSKYWWARPLPASAGSWWGRLLETHDLWKGGCPLGTKDMAGGF